jgi:amino acid transporter
MFKDKSLREVFLGKALKSNDLEGEKLSVIWGLPIMSSDAVSSVAYAIEEMLIVLVPVLGVASVNYLKPITLPIILLFLVLAFSYAQIIDNYPNGGGAYVVSSENIGKPAGLVAASALIIDYIMTVAVSLSSATAAFLAAFPQFMAYRTIIALLFLCIITFLNLRGMRESSKIFGVPTYAFMAIMIIMIITGFVRLAAGGISPVEYSPQSVPAVNSLYSVSMFLLLRAFSSGCSALTGIEAVSNAVPSFRKPEQKNAKDVLFILVGIIIFIFGGSILLVTSLRIVPVEGSTVISQMGKAVFGEGIMFYILQFATSLILLLAANTAYNGLPTLLAILSQDHYLPHQFMQRGTRLSFSNGIMFIFFAAGLLLTAFKANTHHLVPLYSVGVFLSFTLSQIGMVRKWLSVKNRGWKHKLVINGLGAVMTATSTVIVFMTKFVQGSWMLAVVIPLLSILMNKIGKYYASINEQLKVEDFMSYYRRSESKDTNLCIVLIKSMNKATLKLLNYANAMTSNVVALHISTDDKEIERLQAEWKEKGMDIPLEFIKAPYRNILVPLEKYLEQKEEDIKSGETISVVMGRFVEEHWYESILHNQSTYFIERELKDHKNVATVIVPFLWDFKRASDVRQQK